MEDTKSNGFTALLGKDRAKPQAPERLDSQGSNSSARNVARSSSGSPMHTSPSLAPFGLEPPNASPLSRHLTPLILDESAMEAEERILSRQSTPARHGEQSLAVWLRKLLAFTGPGWLMSVAYIDPGNLEADLQCGAQFGYRLLWALLYSTAFGLAMQLTAARLGVYTRCHLAELCRKHYTSKPTRILLWLATEMAIIGSDIQEVIGCSIGLEIMFGLPLTCGVCVSAGAAFCFLFLERFGVRPLEMFFGVLILALAISMAKLFVTAQPDGIAVIEGFIFPIMPRSAVQQVVGMVGCVVMPHNLYLHSALVQSRVIEEGQQQEAMTLFTIESSLAIFTSLLINMCVVTVFAKGFFGAPGAADLGLRNAGQFLAERFGTSMQMIWALGLVASGQSSTMTGAYTGQWVMQGFLNLSVAPWKRAIITRGIALIPCLTVAIYFGGGHSGLDLLNSYLNVLQSLVLPFALVPLITFASSPAIMGDAALAGRSAALAWAATVVLIATNLYLFLVEFWPDPSSNASPVVYISLSMTLVVYVAALGFIFCAADLNPPTESQDALK